MSDDQNNEAPAEGNGATPPEDGRKQDTAGPELHRALRAEREARQTLEKRIKAYEDKDKSEQDKLNDRIAAAEKRAADAESKALRFEVAAAKGLSQAQAKRLVGTTKDELEADADELLETFSTANDRKTPPTRRPVENLRGGSEPDIEPEEDDPIKLAARHPRPGF